MRRWCSFRGVERECVRYGYSELGNLSWGHGYGNGKRDCLCEVWTTLLALLGYHLLILSMYWISPGSDSDFLHQDPELISRFLKMNRDLILWVFLT